MGLAGAALLPGCEGNEGVVWELWQGWDTKTRPRSRGQEQNPISTSCEAGRHAGQGQSVSWGWSGVSPAATESHAPD